MPFIIFAIILSILILVHEWGHFITARKCGVTVEQFALGFGPKLLGWKRGGCEYCLCLIPLGGFVKMAGDEREKCSGKSDEYFAKPASQRALIVLMGPVVNLILAYMCFWVVFMIGYPDMEQSSEKVPAVIGQVLPHSAAEQGGIKVGDKVIAINGKPITRWTQLQDLTANSTGSQINLTVERDHHEVSLAVTPQVTARNDIFGGHHQTRRMGVGPMPLNDAKDIVIVRYGVFPAMVKAGQQLGDITLKTYGALYQIAIGAISPRDALGGPITMFVVIKNAMSIGFACVLFFVGFISASLGIFNLLPVIPLDGGHLFLIGLEKLRGRALSFKTDQFVLKTGFSLILILIVFVLYSDCDRFGLIDKMVKFFKGTGF